MRKRIRSPHGDVPDLYSHPKPHINLLNLSNLKRNVSLRKYRDIIESLGDGNGNRVQYYSDIIGHHGFFYDSEKCPTVWSYGSNNDSHMMINVFRRLRLPPKLEQAIVEKCVEFS